VAESSLVEVRSGFLSKSQIRKVDKLNHLNLSHLWNLSNKYGLSLEIAATEEDEWRQEELDKIMDRLDRRGGNPFNYAEVYPSLDEFIAEIPYRNNLRGIVDVRERVMRYGSYGIELDNL